MSRQIPSSLGCFIGPVLIVVSGLVVGIPALDGEVLSGDDDHLIFNHALVNHPSLSHGLKLFAIPAHRDLYQPLPLLTYQIEFSLHRELVTTPEEYEAFCRKISWWMHATNLLLHVINGLLVWMLLYRISRDRILACLVSLTFVVHPLSVELHAWLSGRMMLLSTTFTLLCVITFDCWAERQRGVLSTGASSARATNSLGILLFLFCAVLAMISKVQALLPLFVLVLPMWRRYRPAKSWWGLWGVLWLITGYYVWLNWGATRESRMIEGAEYVFSGPNFARVIAALGWYIQHYFWPTKLSPYYPAPGEISWGDPVVIQAGVVLLALLIAILLSLKKTHKGLAGTLWFLAGVAPTLPFIPTRNLLVADRYVYLGNIGLSMLVFYAFLFVLRNIFIKRSTDALVTGLCCAVMLPVFCTWGAQSRIVAEYYSDDFSKINRILEIAPEHPGMLTSKGWYYFESGEYEKSIALASEEIDRHGDDPIIRVRALNLRGVSYYKYGQPDRAVEDLNLAIELEPEWMKSHYYMGLIQMWSGQIEDAITQLSKAVELAPEYNPAVDALADSYRKKGDYGRAIEMYQLEIENSKGYSVDAINALGELEIQFGHFDDAIGRYRDMLEWRRHGIWPAVTPRINLAIALAAVGEEAEAIDVLYEALEYVHDSYEVRMNLGTLLASQGRTDEALSNFIYLTRRFPEDKAVAIRTSDFLRRIQDYRGARDVWLGWTRQFPADLDGFARLALHSWFALDFEQARKGAVEVIEREPDASIAHLTLALCALMDSSPQDLDDELNLLTNLEPDSQKSAYHYAYEALELFSVTNPQSPWPFYAMSRLLHAQGRHDLAQRAMQEFAERCSLDEWTTRLRGHLNKATGNEENAE